jgi:NAD(P)H dehydrogenase (quinone)
MKILIVYYSLYGHVFKLAQAVKDGAESVKGAGGRVAEITARVRG